MTSAPVLDTTAQHFCHAYYPAFSTIFLTENIVEKVVFYDLKKKNKNGVGVLNGRAGTINNFFLCGLMIAGGSNTIKCCFLS